MKTLDYLAVLNPSVLRRIYNNVEVSGDCIFSKYSGPKTSTGQIEPRIGINRKKYLVARLILTNHLGRNLLPGLETCHAPIICHDSRCINIEHLREDIHSNNQNDKVLDSTDARGENHVKSKLREVDIIQIIVLQKEGKTHQEIADIFKVVRSTISKMLSPNQPEWSWFTGIGPSATEWTAAQKAK